MISSLIPLDHPTNVPEVLTVYDGEWDQISVPNARAIALLGSTWHEALAVIEAAEKADSAAGDHPDSRIFYTIRLRNALKSYRTAVRAHREGVNPGFHDGA